MSPAKIPVVDIGAVNPYLQRSSLKKEDLEASSSEIREALSKSGFVYIKGHGFPEDLRKATFNFSKEYFEGHSIAEKTKSFEFNISNCQGYSAPYSENLSFLAEEKLKEVLSELKEAVDITDVEGFFPDEQVPEMRPHFKELQRHLVPLALRILELISLSLNLPIDFLPGIHKKIGKTGNMSHSRSLYYPPVPGGRGCGLTRCGDHFDYGSITLLFQDSMGGLEVKDIDDGWIPAPPIEGCILVNLGFETEILTNGRYIATRHRVVVPEEEAHSLQPRQSLVFFVNTDEETLLQPVRGEEPRSEKYGPIKAKDNFEALLAGAAVAI